MWEYLLLIIELLFNLYSLFFNHKTSATLRDRRHINLKSLHNIIGLQRYDYMRIPRHSNCLAEYESWCLNFGQELCLKINQTHGYFCQFCIVMLIIKFSNSN